MRLIRTATLQLEDFIACEDSPNYAILSHTWGREEITFADFGKPAKHHLAGFKKIQGCCELARSRGHDFVWVDTCCIDKSSSAELSEAINTMYQWYWESDECFVYLSDVSMEANDKDWLDCFEKSRWWTRGWTLQELLAPSNLIFYDKDWNELGSKSSLCGEITDITGIRAYNVCRNPRDASIAQKMAWASSRRTTRIEDVAYCLLGLFDINMSLLYGEREKAFERLQKKILKRSDDESIFAWTNKDWVSGGLLAKSPADFARSGNLVSLTHRLRPSRAPCTYTSKGLCFDMQGWVVWENQAPMTIDRPSPFTSVSVIRVPICCKAEGDDGRYVTIYLIFYPNLFPNRMRRVFMDEIVYSDGQLPLHPPMRKSTYIDQHFTRKGGPLVPISLPLRMLVSPLDGTCCGLIEDTESWHKWRMLAPRIMKKNSVITSR